MSDSKRLTQQEMNEALTVMNEAVQDVVKFLSLDEKMRDTVIRWLVALKLHNVHFIFRPDFKQQLEDDVFANEDETLRNFLFDVQFRFYAVAGTTTDFFRKLSRNLEDALLIEGRITDYNVLPEAITDSAATAMFPRTRQSSYKVVRWLQRINPFRSYPTLGEFLQNNPLYIIVLLLYLVIDHDMLSVSKESETS